MADPIGSLKGITEELAARMMELGIKDTAALLAATEEATPRRKLAVDLGIEPAQLTELINRADLCRIKGVGGVYADLLEFAGVDSVKELSHRVPTNLHAKLEQVNDEQKLTGRIPSLTEVEGWVQEAQDLSLQHA